MTQRIELFKHDSQNWFLQYDSENSIFEKKKHIDAKNWSLLLEYDAKNWTLLLEYDAKNWNLVLEYDAKNLTLFLEYDAKNWTFKKKGS